MTQSPREFIGRYRIIKLLGRGAMGQVYLAHDPKIDRLVAIKTIIQDAAIPEAEREENRVRFLREAQAAGKLLHPAIVTIFDVAEEEGEMYIAMEYIEGEPLDKYCEKGNLLPHARVIEYVRQAAEGLDYAHQYQVVHRDIKPANMMVVGNRALKITDFGLAKNPSTSITQQGMLVGTPNYMSPEQIQGHELDGRSDLFSLAVVMYELLTGERPFRGKSISTVIYKILHDQAASLNELVPSLPPAYDAVMKKALAKDPKARFASGTQFAAALREVLERPEAVPPPAVSADQAAATRIEPRPEPARSIPALAATGAAPIPALPDLGSGERAVSRTRVAPSPAGFRPKKKGGALWAAGLLLVAGAGAVAWYLKNQAAAAPGSASLAVNSAPRPPSESGPRAASAPSSAASVPPSAPGSAPQSAPASAASAAVATPSGSAPPSGASSPGAGSVAAPPAARPEPGGASAPASAAVPAPAGGEGRVKVTGGNWLITVKGVKGGFRAGQPFALPPGPQQLVLTLPELFATVSRTVTVKSGETQELNLPRPAIGTLKVLSIQEARISVDGRPVDVTPMTREIAAGRHAVSAKGSESGEYWDSQLVDIRAGETVTVKFRAPD